MFKSTKKNKREEPDDTTQQKEPQTKRTKRQAGSGPFDGSAITKDEWVLPQDRAAEYQAIFSRTVLQGMPKAKNSEGQLTQYCNHALANKKCRLGNNCSYLHEKPSEQNKEAKVDAFYQAAYRT